MSTTTTTVEEVIRLEAGRLGLRVAPPEGVDLQFVYRAAMCIYWNPTEMLLEDRSESELSASASAERLRRAMREEMGLVLVPSCDLRWCGVDEVAQGEVARALFG